MRGFWGDTPAPAWPGFKDGIFYRAREATANQNGVLAANIAAFHYFFVEEPGEMDLLALSIQAGAAGLCKLAAYEWRRDGGAVKLGETTADMSTAAAVSLEGSFAARVPVRRGSLLLASCFSGTPTARCQAAQSPGPVATLGSATSDNALGNTNLTTGFTMALTYVAGPTPFFPATIAAGSLARSISANVPVITPRFRT